MRGLTLAQHEQGRLRALNLVLEGRMEVAEAATILGLSERHAWRILAAYRRDGVAALAHGNRGCRPANTISEETRQRVITLARTQYAGLNHTHLTELLAEREALTLSRSTVRNILVGAGLGSPRNRRSPRHRCRRGIFFGHMLGNPYLDGAASIIIGLLLMGCRFHPGIRNEGSAAGRRSGL